MRGKVLKIDVVNIPLEKKFEMINKIVPVNQYFLKWMRRSIYLYVVLYKDFDTVENFDNIIYISGLGHKKIALQIASNEKKFHHLVINNCNPYTLKKRGKNVTLECQTRCQFCLLNNRFLLENKMWYV